jgi:hypothetical protein
LALLVIITPILGTAIWLFVHYDRWGILSVEALGGTVDYEHVLPKAWQDFFFPLDWLMVRANTVSLQNLHITDKQLTCLRHFQAITQLNLDGTRITDDGVSVIARLPSLRFLVLNNSAITFRGLEQLAKLPNIHLIGASHIVLTSNQLETIRSIIQQKPNLMIYVGNFISLYDHGIPSSQPATQS